MKKILLKILIPFPYWFKKFVFKTWCLVTEAGRLCDKGERFVVSSWKEISESGEFYHLYHAFRYWWANKQIPQNTRILDLGCGSGYGGWYLRSKKRKVIGIDVNRKIILWARKHFSDFNVRFLEVKDFNIKKEYDVITCFEVLEHDSSIIKTIVKCLKDNGLLLISTANGSQESIRLRLIHNNLSTRNPSHIKEFTSFEFKQLLEKYFNKVELYGQCIKGVNGLQDWLKWRKKGNITFDDFEMRKRDFINCEVLVAKCQGKKEEKSNKNSFM